MELSYIFHRTNGWYSGSSYVELMSGNVTVTYQYYFYDKRGPWQ
jgi:hypothetical protein